jgi:hypothetical protein
MALQELSDIRREIKEMWWQTMENSVSSMDTWNLWSEALMSDGKTLVNDIEASKASADAWKRYGEKLKKDINAASENEAARLKRLGNVLEEIETKMRNASFLECE